MLAVTHPGAVPAIDEDGVHLVARHDFALHLGHELEVVGTEPAGHPHLRRGPMPTRLARGVHRNPIRMRRLHVIVGRVRVGAGDDDHAQFTAAGDDFAEGIGLAKPLAAVVKRNLRRVIRHAPTGAEANRVGARALEVIEPELRVELARVILHERELRPAHRFVHPTRRWRGCSGRFCCTEL